MKEQDLYVLANMYQNSESDLAKNNYEMVAKMIIKKQPRERISELEKLWEELKDNQNIYK